MKKKKRSAAWQKARAERAWRRRGRPMQPRNAEGYIIKVVDGVVTAYDPGEIDRALYVRDRAQAKKESWEVPNA